MGICRRVNFFVLSINIVRIFRLVRNLHLFRPPSCKLIALFFRCNGWNSAFPGCYGLGADHGFLVKRNKIHGLLVFRRLHWNILCIDIGNLCNNGSLRRCPGKPGISLHGRQVFQIVGNHQRLPLLHINTPYQIALFIKKPYFIFRRLFGKVDIISQGIIFRHGTFLTVKRQRRILRILRINMGKCLVADYIYRCRHHQLPDIAVRKGIFINSPASVGQCHGKQSVGSLESALRNFFQFRGAQISRFYITVHESFRINGSNSLHIFCVYNMGHLAVEVLHQRHMHALFP